MSRSRAAIFSFIFLMFMAMFPLLAQAQAEDPAAVFMRSDPKTIPTAYIDEAEAFRKKCEGDENMKEFYNCECMAVKYLDERITRGPDANESSIRFSIQGQCKDSTYQAGIMFNRCLNGIDPPEGVDPGKFCECVANSYAKMYESIAGALNSDRYVAMRSRAVIACKNPALARELYSYVPTPTPSPVEQNPVTGR